MKEMETTENAWMTGIKNQIQTRLMADMGYLGDVQTIDWITQYSEKFDHYIQANRDLCELWENADDLSKKRIAEFLIQNLTSNAI